MSTEPQHTQPTSTEPTHRFTWLNVVLFVCIIAALTWAAIQLVQLALPTGVSKLASLAERVNNSQQTILDLGRNTVDTIAIDTKNAFTSAGVATTLSWEAQPEVGFYTISYDCVDGVSIDTELDGAVSTLTCNTPYVLGDVTSATVTINSTEDRYTDVTYHIAFTPDNQNTFTARGDRLITVVNNDISNLFADNSTDPTPTISNEAATDSTTPTPVVAGASTDTPDYTPVENTVTMMPVSDVNGHTDLATRLIATGNIVGDTFFPQPIIKDHRGAVQFEVKNVGSKTSDTWAYTLTLPSGGTYTSSPQEALKPNERALITVGFPTPAITDYTFTVAVDTSHDSANLNNQFTGEVAFVN